MSKVKEEVKVKGRPSNPQSKRQQKMTERELKKEAGMLKRGRPSVEGSKRQIVLAAREAKKAAGIDIKRGRPKVEKAEKPAKVKKVKATVEIIEAAQLEIV